jgi:hypothetical protein
MILEDFLYKDYNFPNFFKCFPYVNIWRLGSYLEHMGTRREGRLSRSADGF